MAFIRLSFSKFLFQILLAMHENDFHTEFFRDVFCYICAAYTERCCRRNNQMQSSDALNLRSVYRLTVYDQRINIIQKFDDFAIFFQKFNHRFIQSGNIIVSL
jgi:hypothetical protein